MLAQLLTLPLWALMLGVATVYGQKENDFEDSSTTKRVPMSAFSLSAPYLDTDMGNRWFDFGGDTVVRTDQYIRLTSDRPSQRGWLFSRVPLSATNWQIEAEIKIHGDGNLYGDGLAMWLTKQRAAPGPVFGSADKFEGLGIFFDTYKNGRTGVSFPLVMAMMGDGRAAYDSAHDGKANDIASCSARGFRGASVPTKFRLTYFQDKYLALDLRYKSEDAWTACFKVSASDDLAIKVPSVSYIGFTAETGELSDNHDVISVNTYSLYSQGGSQATAPGSSGSQKGKGKVVTGSTEDKSGGGWLWSFFKLIMFILVLGGCYVGWTVYRTNRGGARF